MRAGGRALVRAAARASRKSHFFTRTAVRGGIARRYCTEAVEPVGNNEVRNEETKSELTPGDALGLSVVGLTDAIVRGKVTAEQVVEESIKRLQRDGVLFHTVVCVSNRAVGEAIALDQHLKETGTPTGPLHGVPVLVSDNIHVSGFPTTLGCSAFANYHPSKSAPVVDALVSAGAIIVGKANMDELGLGKVGVNQSTGSITNPLDASYLTGGSQGGCAAAVLSEAVPVSIGCDMGGDLLIPSGYCGVHAWVPTAGRYSRSRTWMTSTSLGSVGVVAKTITDVKLVDTVLSASTKQDKESMHFMAGMPSEPLIAEKLPHLLLPEDAFNIITAKEVERLLRITFAVLVTYGTKVSESIKEATYGRIAARRSDPEDGIEVPENLTLRQVPHLWGMCHAGLQHESVAVLQALCKKTGVDWETLVSKITVPYVRNVVSGLDTGDMETIYSAQAAQEELVATLEKYWSEVPESVDALVMPICIAEPQPANSTYAQTGLVTWNGVSTTSDLLTRNTGPFALGGYPMVTLPFGVKLRDVHSGGLLLVGRKGADHSLLEAAAVVDQQVKMAAEHLEGSLQKIKETDPNSEDAWLDDRAKNSWTMMYDAEQAGGKQGHFSMSLYKMRHLYPNMVTEKLQEKRKQYEIDLRPSKEAVLKREAAAKKDKEQERKAEELAEKLEAFKK
eukprot:TRINITY_DN3709_c0_g1_i4.p1 TRINITY_DN3709_c0_g1~~TRINITY_DN3709_c0_g1_i4.p1  ORF type:complete len:695 (+),score=170.05 TRINITY_DN3709_c0_g1_i4:60-2087(+)